MHPAPCGCERETSGSANWSDQLLQPPPLFSRLRPIRPFQLTFRLTAALCEYPRGFSLKPASRHREHRPMPRAVALPSLTRRRSLATRTWPHTLPLITRAPKEFALPVLLCLCFYRFSV